MPVSPMANYFNSTVLNVFVLGVLESEIPIDDSTVSTLLEHVFLPTSTRFSSIMIMDNKGKKHWKQVDVSVKEHIKIPIFPTSKQLKCYDELFNEYITKISTEQLPQHKPLWEMHIIKYPTTNAKGTFIFKLHHSLGDGYTFMTTLLSCVQRADNPSVPITFPSSQGSVKSTMNSKNMLQKLPETFSLVKSAFEFWKGALNGSLTAKDGHTAIRSGHEDVGFRPINVTNVSLSLDNIKEVKNKLRVSVNDALVGMIFLGIRLYMEAMNHESSKANTTALVLLNTRKVRAYKSIKEMLSTNSEAQWGNRICFMQVPIPKLRDTSSSNPLEFVLEANKIIKRKRYSLAVPLTDVLLDLINKIKGPQAAARYVQKTLNNASLSISHMVGPVEQVSLANHPIKGFYFMTVGLSQSLTVTITSYMGYLRVGFGVEKGFIDEHQLNSCFQTSMEMMLNATRT
ncbi:PREDICTED: O-acyltransferase WSD1-like [Lupinus angustifolius]|nr:PREDICTED: O-acyltransferase WSD1-like [Lupinus angustifolius]